MKRKIKSSYSYHKADCQCCCCQASRGELFPPMTGKSQSIKAREKMSKAKEGRDMLKYHKENCSCCFCITKRGERSGQKLSEGHKKNISNGKKGKKSFWKDKIDRYSKETLIKMSESRIKYLIKHPVVISKETRIKMSKSHQRNGNSGGLRKGGGRGKHGWYKGYWCDSSWELAWVIYNLEHGIEFQRNTQSFSYMFKGKAHKYYPDFILPNGSFVEIKGWFNEQTQKKIESVPSDIVVLTGSDLAPMINYCKNKYEADYCQLYENRGE